MASDSHARQLAAGILDAVRAATPGVHCIRVVDAAGFDHLDAAFYQAAAAGFTALGFSLLADIQDMSVCEGTGVDTYARALAGGDGSVTATIVHACPRPGIPGRLRAIVLGDDHPRVIAAFTRFSDGTTLTTTSEPPAAALPLAVTDSCVRVAAVTSPRDLVAGHIAGVKRHLAARPGTRIRPVRNLVDYLQAVNDMGERRRQLLQQEGWVKAEYVEARVGAQDAALVHAMLLKMLREERARAGATT